MYTETLLIKITKWCHLFIVKGAPLIHKTEDSSMHSDLISDLEVRFSSLAI